MDMKQEVKLAIKEAFQAAMEYLQTVTIITKQFGEFDPETGSVPVVDVTAEVEAIVRGYSDLIVNSSNGNINASDRKVMFQSSDLAITPTTSDYVKINNEDYAIINIKSDVGGNIWILQVRKS